MKIAKLIMIMLLTMRTMGIANNVQIANVSLNGQNDYTMVKFDINWDNSWRVDTAPANWDASWVFVKYRLINEDTWNHATLLHAQKNQGGHVAPAGAVIYSSDDTGLGGSYGVFIHRDINNATIGNVNFSNVALRWNYADDGLADDDSVEVCVFAIEMVYVLEGSFYLGSGGNEVNHFYKRKEETLKYQVVSENRINIARKRDRLYYTNNNAFAGDQSGKIYKNFPKGYNAFYCMKYEITQGQYAAFLNKLTAAQASARQLGNAASGRSAITGNAPGSYVATSPFVSCNTMSWADMAAYLDWAALRPITELEFVKACRGPVDPTANEYTWGNTDIANNGYTLNNAGANNEGIATNYSVTTAGNAMYNTTASTISGPARVGIFAAHPATTGRETAGSSYYGIMELGGNLPEQCVTIGNAAGRNFRGAHGDGVITQLGDANVTKWPDSTASGIGQFGGGFLTTNTALQVSDRSSASNPHVGTQHINGGRGVRSEK